MTTRAKRKAKFRVGQVVFVRRTDFMFKIKETEKQSGKDYYWPPQTSVGYEEKELRPLTKREKG